MLLQIFLLVFLQCASSQICKETRSVLRDFPQTYRYSYYEAYKDTGCIYLWCIKSRQAYNISTRIVQEYVNETVYVCCEGYEEIIQDNDEIICKPICNPSCKNGYCQENQCICYPGFTAHMSEPNICFLNNSSGIGDENSYKPYDYYNDTEANSDCDCQCDKKSTTDVYNSLQNPSCSIGYYLNDDQICVPHCDGCGNGICVEPNVCECRNGYYYNYMQSHCVEDFNSIQYCEHLKEKCILHENECESDDKETKINDGTMSEIGKSDKAIGNCTETLESRREMNSDKIIDEAAIPYVWFYAIIIIGLLIILILTCLLVKGIVSKRRSKTFNLEGIDNDIAVHYTKNV